MADDARQLTHWLAVMSPRKRALLSVLAGVLAATGQAPLDLWPLAVLGLAGGLGLFLAAATAKQAFVAGWALGTGYFLIALSWIVEPFWVDIARHGWMAPFALLFMSGGLALFWGGALWGASKIRGGAFAWIVFLSLAELARSYVLTGFPWALIGHLWIDSAMLHWASYVGAVGLTGLALGMAAVIWYLIVPGRRLIGLAGAVILAALYVLGAQALQPPPSEGQPQVQDAERPVVRLIQPNAPQHEKWDRAKIPVFFERQRSYSAAAPRPDLIIWPETAVPVLLNNAQPTLQVIADAADGVPVVLGIQRLDGMRLFNSLAVLGEDGLTRAIYDKYHLVPFGEYLPFGRYLKQFGLRGLAAEDGNGYSAGDGAALIDLGALGRALPLICYEAVFAQDVGSAPARPDFLLQITNDAWFGQVFGPYQHLAQARLRSVEQGLPMVRVANTGISAVIDGRGRVLAQLPLGQAGYLDHALPEPLSETVYARTGDWLVSILLTIFALLAARVPYWRRAATNQKGIDPHQRGA